MHVQRSETMMVEAIVIEALRIGGLSLMKQSSVARNLGKTPELVLAESFIAAYMMLTSQIEEDDPA